MVLEILEGVLVGLNHLLVSFDLCSQPLNLKLFLGLLLDPLVLVAVAAVVARLDWLVLRDRVRVAVDDLTVAITIAITVAVLFGSIRAGLMRVHMVVLLLWSLHCGGLVHDLRCLMMSAEMGVVAIDWAAAGQSPFAFGGEDGGCKKAGCKCFHFTF